MATLTVQSMDFEGLEAAYVAADVAGDEFVNASDERTFLHVKNGAGSDVTVTVAANDANKSGYGTIEIADTDVVVTAGEERMIGPFPYGRFSDEDGLVQVTYSAITSVTVAAIKLSA